MNVGFSPNPQFFSASGLDVGTVGYHSTNGANRKRHVPIGATLRRRIEMTKGSGYRASRPYHAAGEMRLPQVSFQRMASPSRERCPFRASDIIHYRLLSGQPDGAYGFDATLKSWRKNARARSRIDAAVAKLKSTIPLLEHAALDSRLEELLNDSSADLDDVILILRQEFDPQHKQ